MRDTAEFDAFVAAQSPSLLRLGWLLTGTREAGQDLVQGALLKAWRGWDKVERAEDPARYVRAILVNAHATARRRRWRDEVATADLPDVAAPAEADADVRRVFLAALRSLPPRQRTVMALRFYEDVTEAETARLMRCSVGTVKSQTAKALKSLRAHPALAALLEEGVPR